MMAEQKTQDLSSHLKFCNSCGSAHNAVYQKTSCIRRQ